MYVNFSAEILIILKICIFIVTIITKTKRHGKG